jgi:uncharacterized protein (TIGR03118 family)
MNTSCTTARALRVAVVLASTLATVASVEAASRAYEQHNLVSDVAGADHVDPATINTWGIAFGPTNPVWVANNHSGFSTLYDGLGTKVPLDVAIPPPAGGGFPSAPTGVVFNPGTDFAVTANAATGASRFIFATEDGTISGWAPNVDGTNAILAVDNSGSGAIYKGLALAANGAGRFLYATDFHNGKIDVFDSSFHPATLSGNFHDRKIPSDFAPFGIQNIGGDLYVTFAKQGPGAVDDTAGPGLGFVDIFDANGQLIRRFATRGRLNAPWGLALSPAGFGRFRDCLLIGNFGDGKINAYDISTGASLGPLRGKDGMAIAIDGLWGIAFGNGVLQQPTNTLFFTAGPHDEDHGLYGRIDSVPGRDDDRDDDR